MGRRQNCVRSVWYYKVVSICAYVVVQCSMPIILSRDDMRVPICEMINQCPLPSSWPLLLIEQKTPCPYAEYADVSNAPQK